MTNPQRVMEVAERILEEGEASNDLRFQELAHTRAQTLYLAAILTEIVALRAEIAPRADDA